MGPFLYKPMDIQDFSVILVLSVHEIAKLLYVRFHIRLPAKIND